MNLNLILLAICQALMMTTNTLTITTSALVGARLAPDPSLATLPLAAQFLATMLTTLPASLFMGRFGRKAGFILAAVIGVCAGICATVGILSHQYWLFVTGAALAGVFVGFGGYIRFAAAEVVRPDYKSIAISWVMAGGVVAAISGPNLARLTRDVVPDALFAGSFAVTILIYLSIGAIMTAVTFPPPPAPPPASERTPLKQIITRPRFVIAVICGALGYAVMSLVMTATPLAMAHHHHHFGDTTFVIQWHVLGMFAPSFFTGYLIKRFGLSNILLTGALLGLATVIINLTGQTVTYFWAALVALGVSWNFLFIGATTLLTETYQSSEKTRAQGFNDFIVFTAVTMAALSAGALQHRFGWKMVNLGVLPLLFLILSAVIWLKTLDRKPA